MGPRFSQWETSHRPAIPQSGTALHNFSDESGEEQWYALGATDSLRVLFLVLTFRGDIIRPITGWDASKKLREAYFRKNTK